MSNQPGKNIIFCLTLIFSTISSCHALDLTPFYRAAIFQGTPKTNHRSFTTIANIQFHEENTRTAWNSHETLTPLFNDRGAFDLTRIGLNLEGLTAESKPLTYECLRGTTTGDDCTILDPGRFTALGEKGIGKFIFSGRFYNNQLGFELQQNLMYGFYLMTHIPFREVRICDIDFRHCGNEPETEEEKAAFQECLDNLDPILAENGLLPVKTNYHRTRLSDIVIAAGWQGYDNTSFDLINSLQAFVQMGLLMPTGEKDPINRVFFVPSGYRHQWGVDSRFCVQANFLQYVGLGVYGGITILLNETHPRRLATDCLQNGWIRLECARTTMEQGNIWNAGVFVKGDHLIGGLSLLGAYAYTKQERSFYIVKDCNYLKSFVDANLKRNPPVIVSRDGIASSDTRIHGWNQHVIHFVAEYDAGVHADRVIIPQVAFSYSVSICGQNSWRTNMIGGNAQLVLSWKV